MKNLITFIIVCIAIATSHVTRKNDDLTKDSDNQDPDIFTYPTTSEEYIRWIIESLLRGKDPINSKADFFNKFIKESLRNCKNDSWLEKLPICQEELEQYIANFELKDLYYERLFQNIDD